MGPPSNASNNAQSNNSNSLHIITIESNHVPHLITALDADREHLGAIVEEYLPLVDRRSDLWVIDGPNGDVRIIGNKYRVQNEIEDLCQLVNALRGWDGGRVMVTEGELLSLDVALETTTVVPEAVVKAVQETIDRNISKPESSEVNVDIL